MKKKGFRNPEIVEWCDGRKTNLSDVNGGEPITYRIEIKGGELDDMIHEVIETMAAESQITKIAEESFIVGIFDSKAIAERLAQAIAKCNESLDVQVVELKPESDEENEEDEEAQCPVCPCRMVKWRTIRGESGWKYYLMNFSCSQ